MPIIRTLWRTGGAGIFEKAIASEPDFAPAYTNLGTALMKSGRFANAATAFERAVQLEPDNALGYNNLGAVLLRQGREDEAIARFKKAIKLEPDLAMAHNNLGNALKEQGRLEEAVAIYRKALLIKPVFAMIHSNLGILLKDLGRYDEAEECLNRALDLKPDDTKTRYNHATVHKFVPGDPEIEKLKELLGRKGFSEDQKNPLLFSLGKAHDDIGRYAEAFSYYATANEENAGRTKFDASDHRKQIMAIKHLFRERHDSAGEGSGDAERVPIFVVGMSRSGKTLVGTLLSQHEDACGARESHEWPNAIKEVLDKHSIPGLFPDRDDIGRYAEASSYYATANEENAGRTKFDASDHRKQIMAIKHLFRERHDSAGEGSGDAERVPIFVVGMSRSGKTLVGTLLSQHEDACGARESHEWPNAIKEVLDKHSIPGLFPNYMASLSDDHIREIGKIYMENLVENSPNSNLFIDTNPGNYRYIGMILQALPMAKIIYCHRDPIDNCLFVYFYRYARENYYSYDLSNLASYYADYQDIMAHWRRLYGDHIFSVRYEELVRNPTDIGSRIYQFYGLDYDATSVRCAFTTDEIGHWKHYESYLGPLRQALGGLAR